ncbi:hypothetical protein, partial [uncultured Nocardioides sp.]|uniref:hypothetical protein n=1 Tax=uncultured Nocardioides sp. TaxID=198441 RepID=UPI0030FBEDD4
MNRLIPALTSALALGLLATGASLPSAAEPGAAAAPAVADDRATAAGDVARPALRTGLTDHSF